ncbi:hypothetical protein F4677DRAFT_457950 [Hypoxylon crocopeplum]|nr:hypothetical protein F4677DRAFT_457950 [Hypoxylon crocopeplum]
MLSQPEVNWIVTASILFPVSTVFISLRVLAIRIRGAGFKLHNYLVFVSYFCQIVYMIHFTIVIGTSIVVFLWWIACIITICALCQPTAYNWDRTLNGTCGNIGVVYIFTAAWNMALDIWVVFLPLPLIWKLQLSACKKASLTASFALGFCTAGISLGRLVQNSYCPPLDVSYCAFDSYILVIAELAGGILVATVPTLRPLLPTKGPGTRTGRREPLKKEPTLSASLFSQTDTKVQHEELSVEITSRGANMGHLVEVGRAGASCDSIEDHLAQPY